jgi:hypothetical protein
MTFSVSRLPLVANDPIQSLFSAFEKRFYITDSTKPKTLLKLHTSGEANLESASSAS